MVYESTKKRTASRLKLRGSLEKAKISVRRLRSSRNLRNSVNKSEQSSTSQTKSRNVPPKKRVASVERKSLTKVNNTPVRRTRAKGTKNTSNNASQSKKEEPIVKLKKGVAVKNNKKITKRKVVNIKKDKLNDSTSLRQMSLKESFSKQVLIARLRPRVKQKDYSEETRLKEREQENTRSGPIYKRLNMTDDDEQDKSDVYDFQFDNNDSRERVVRKKKRRIMRKGVLKANTKKKLAQKRALPLRAEPKLAASKEVPMSESEPFKTPPDNNVEPGQSEAGITNVENVTTEVNETLDEPSISANVESVERVEQNNVTTSKPKVVSVEYINRKNITVIPPSTKLDDSLRPSGAFAKPPNQYRSMVNHSLLNKSLSPIVKLGENFDVGSPWRPPQFSQFSHVKDLFQSTPHIKKLDVYTGRIVRNVNNIENIAPKRMEVVEKAMKNSGSLTRKFGTEITNIDSSIPSSPNVNEDRNDTVPESQSAHSITHTDAPVVAASPNVSFNDIAEDKENAVPNFQTPKKMLTKKKKKKHADRVQALQQVVGRRTLQSKENFEPQPGPSTLQKISPPKETQVLRQSNLSGFLSLTRMPESSKIMTPHGIFDDVHSTPINGKQPKKLQQQKPREAVENAFGFSDSDSDLDISPISADAQTEDAKKPGKQAVANVRTETVVPARLSIGEIQRKLLVPKKAKKKGPVQMKLERPDNGGQEVPEKKENPRKKALIDISNFSDTFDVMSETADSVKDESMKDFPLFVDLEPSRFTEPARHSYKRKRNVRFSFSEGSDVENEHAREPEAKKKKVNKLNKADQRRLKNWVENVNQTFEEIDQFDLVIE